MSGIYLGSRVAGLAEDSAKRLAFTADTTHTTGVCDSLEFAVTRVDSQLLWGPATDVVSGVKVLLGGRVSFEETEWQRAETLPYAGGLACRLILEKWLTHPDGLAEWLNGAFCVIILDPLHQRLHCVTDRLGVYPIYQSVGCNFGLCSHTDVLADSLKEQGETCELDKLTLAECFGTAYGGHPFTYYQQIHALHPATHYTWRLPQPLVLEQERTYWQPEFLTETPSNDAEAMAEALAIAIRNAVRRRTNPRLGKPVLMLSGGADSRAALFGAQDPAKVTCFTLYDEPNPEFYTAQKLARLAGAAHHALPRDPDYYGRTAEESVRIAGGFWSILDAHYLGAIDRLKAEQPGVVLTGCYADYMFKGLMLNRKHRKLLGRNLPLYEFAPFDYTFYHDNLPLRDVWQQQVRERLETRYPEEWRANYPAHRLAVEDRRLRPLACEADASGRLMLWRTLPWDHLLSDSEVLAVYGRLAAELKLNGVVFGAAVGKIIGKEALKIHNNNYGTKVNATESERAFWFLVSVFKRKIRRLLGSEPPIDQLATPGSWPNWHYYVAHSPELARLWAEPSAGERELFSDILGADPWKKPLAVWAQENPVLLVRLITAKIWLSQRGLGQ
ncbi:MAG: asparagine synthase-related protein [Luteolibacter sp.]